MAPKNQNIKTQYDYMRSAENSEEDAMFPEEINSFVKQSDKEKYFEYYDDVKINHREDW